MGILKKKSMVLFRYKKNQTKSKEKKDLNQNDEYYKNYVKMEEDIDNILKYLKDYDEISIYYPNDNKIKNIL